jgi:hypothetical protein
MANYLITGYWGEPHVTAENDRGFNAAVFGAGRIVLPVGERLRAEYIGNNTVRIYDGKLLDNGALAGIPAGKYVDLLIPEAGQGMNRSDLVIFQYRKDPSTLVETGEFLVLQGTETSGVAYDPPLEQQDLLSDEATFDQMALWRVGVSGANIAAPVQVAEVSRSLPELKNKGVVISAKPVIRASAWYEYEGGYSNSVDVAGLTVKDEPIVDINLNDVGVVGDTLPLIEEYSKIYRFYASDGALWIYASEKPERDIPIKIMVVR